MSKQQSSTEPEFALVYDGKAPKSLHARTEKECWAGHMREATPEELEQLKDARCKHCVTRVARDAARAQTPARATIPARKPAKPSEAAEKAQVTA